MGGQKKKPISRVLKRLEAQKKEKTKKKVYNKEKKEQIVAPGEDLRQSIMQQKVITPTSVSKQYGIKVSEAKKILRELENKKRITRIFSSSKLKIYVPTKGT